MDKWDVEELIEISPFFQGSFVINKVSHLFKGVKIFPVFFKNLYFISAETVD
jgi:hypothetical protein